MALIDLDFIFSYDLFWALIIIMLLIRMISDISVRSALAMFVNNCVYSKNAGLVNGYAFSVQEIMRYEPIIILFRKIGNLLVAICDKIFYAPVSLGRQRRRKMTWDSRV